MVGATGIETRHPLTPPLQASDLAWVFLQIGADVKICYPPCYTPALGSRVCWGCNCTLKRLVCSEGIFKTGSRGCPRSSKGSSKSQ